MGNSILRELKEMDKAVKKAGLTEFSEPSPESEILLKAPDIDPDVYKRQLLRLLLASL